MGCGDARPNDVDHVNVNVAAFGRPVLLEQLQRGRRVVWPANIIDRISSLFRPFFCKGLSPAAAFTDIGVTGKMDGYSSI